jgi:starch synthase
MMGLGIYHADVVSTVSETYAREILSPEYGEGLDPVLRHRHANLYGITNGIDYTEFNPRAAPFLAKHYRLGSLGGKRKLKLALQSELGITSDPDIPLLAYIGRLTRQKGIWLLAEGVGKLLEAGKVQLAVLGKAPAGEESYEEMLCSLEVRYPQQVRLTTRYDEPLAHRIYAGADMFVMPSLYEPCGLTQLIALRYGTIPVVRHTGGLVDTVRENSVMGNGFVFHDTRNGADLERAIMRAIELYRQKEHWSRLVARAMCCDVSWERACHQYEEMYQRAIQMRRG